MAAFFKRRREAKAYSSPRQSASDLSAHPSFTSISTAERYQKEDSFAGFGVPKPFRVPPSVTAGPPQQGNKNSVSAPEMTFYAPQPQPRPLQGQSGDYYDHANPHPQAPSQLQQQQQRGPGRGAGEDMTRRSQSFQQQQAGGEQRSPGLVQYSQQPGGGPGQGYPPSGQGQGGRENGRTGTGMSEEQRREYLHRGPGSYSPSSASRQQYPTPPSTGDPTSRASPSQEAYPSPAQPGTGDFGHGQPSLQQHTQQRSVSNPTDDLGRRRTSVAGESPSAQAQTFGPGRKLLTQSVPTAKPTGQGPGPQKVGTMLLNHQGMHDMDRVIGLLRSPKFYYEGFLLRRLLLLPDGSEPKSGDPGLNWAKYYIQIAGTTMSSWDAAEMDRAAKEDRQVAPTYTNITDAQVSFPRNSELKGPTTFLFTMTSAGSNLFLFCCPDQRALTSWMAAIRLAAWERSRLFEIYTGTLIATKLPGNPRSPLEKGRLEGWLKVRLPGDTEWRRLWTVIGDGEASAAGTMSPGEKKTRRSSIFGLAGLGKSGAGSSAGSVHEPEGEAFLHFHVKRPQGGGARRPLAMLSRLHYAAAVYPESKTMIDSSSLFKVEGLFLSGHEGGGVKRGKEGFMLAMADEGRCDEMLKWLLAIMDSFRMYGRPLGLVYDPRDPASVYFAYPIGPARDRLFIDRELAETIAISEDHPRDIRISYTSILFNRMRGKAGGPNSGPPTRTPSTDQDVRNDGSADDGPLSTPGSGSMQQQQRSRMAPPILPPIGESSNRSDDRPNGEQEGGDGSQSRDSTGAVNTKIIGSTGSPPPESLGRPSFLAVRDQPPQSQMPDKDDQPFEPPAVELVSLERLSQDLPPPPEIRDETPMTQVSSLASESDPYTMYYKYQASQPKQEPTVKSPVRAVTAMYSPYTEGSHRKETLSSSPTAASRAPSPLQVPPARQRASGGANSTEDYSDVLAALNFADQHESTENVAVTNIPPPLNIMPPLPMDIPPPPTVPLLPDSADDIYNEDTTIPISGHSAPLAGAVLRPPTFFSRPPPSQTPSIGSKSADNSARASPANGVFPSSFAAGKRATERVAAAQAAQAAGRAASNRPGRPKGVNGKDGKAAWNSDSDEDEEAEEEEEDDRGDVPRPATERPQREVINPQQHRTLPPPPMPASSPNRPPREISHSNNNGVLSPAQGLSRTHSDDRVAVHSGQMGQFPNSASRREIPPVLRAEELPGGLRPALSEHGLLNQRLQEKQARSAHAQQEAAHTYGEPLLHVDSKPPPPQTGLVGAIASHERERKRDGGMGAALTERERDRKAAEHRQREVDEMQRGQLQPPQQMMSPWGMPMGMMGMPMMFPGVPAMSLMGGMPGINPLAPMGQVGAAPQSPGQQGQPAGYEQMVVQQMQMQQAMFAAQQAYMAAMSQSLPGLPQPGVPTSAMQNMPPGLMSMMGGVSGVPNTTSMPQTGSGYLGQGVGPALGSQAGLGENARQEDR